MLTMYVGAFLEPMCLLKLHIFATSKLEIVYIEILVKKKLSDVYGGLS